MTKKSIDECDNISAYDYYTFYMRNSRFFSIIWFVLTICFTLCIIVAFITPSWIGDTLSSSNRGYFGLYRFCTRNSLGIGYRCFGTWTDFSTLPNSAALKAACFFIGFACLLSLLCIAFSLLCIVVKYERIFHICGWIQLLITICVIIGVCVYPVSWNTNIVRSVCGEEANQFKIGTCSVRWAYIIACMSAFQIFFLTILAFLLAARQAKFILMYASNNRYDALETRSNQFTQQSMFG